MLIDLPDCLYEDILSFLKGDHHNYYHVLRKLNKFFNKSLQPPKIHIELSFYRLIISSQYQEIIQKKIRTTSFHQLELIQHEDDNKILTDLTTGGKVEEVANAFAMRFSSFYTLQITLQQFQYFFQLFLQKVHCLKVFIEQSEPSASLPVDLDALFKFLQLRNGSELCLGLKHLILEGSSSLQHLPYIPRLNRLDIGRFHAWSTLDDRYKQCPYLQHLEIVDCQSFFDVTDLGNIPSLTLVQCSKITNITNQLLNNQKIIIRRCWQILDYSQSFFNCKSIALSNINTNAKINFIQCTQLQHLSLWKEPVSPNTSSMNYLTLFPPQIKTIDIMGFDFVVDSVSWSTFSSLRKIIIHSCHEVNQVVGLGSIPDVELSTLPALRSIQGLGAGNQIVKISCCALIKDFSPLNGVSTVKLYACDGFTNINDLRGVQHLSIHYCNFLSDFSPLERNIAENGIQTLELNDCQRIISFQGLRNIPVFEFWRSYQQFFLPQLQDLGGNKKIVLCRVGRKKTINDWPGIHYLRQSFDEINEFGKTFFYKRLLHED